MIEEVTRIRDTIFMVCLVAVGLVAIIGGVMSFRYSTIARKNSKAATAILVVTVVIAAGIIVGGNVLTQGCDKYLALAKRAEDLRDYVYHLDEVGYAGLTVEQQIELTEIIYVLNGDLLKFEEDRPRYYLLPKQLLPIRAVVIPPSLMKVIETE